MVVCRCAAYLLLLWLAAWPLPWREAALDPRLWYLAGVPVLANLLLLRVFAGRQNRAYRYKPGIWRNTDPLCTAHTLEFVLTFAVVLSFQPALFTALAVGWIFIASNTALWGLRVGLLHLLAALGLWQLQCPGCGWISQPRVQDLAALAAALVFMLAICALAYHQAQRFISARRHKSAQLRRLLRYLPEDISPQLNASADVQQRVWMSVAFVDLVGFTRAVRDLPAEQLHEMLNTFLDVTAQLTRQWDGRVSKFLGDGALCVFAARDQQQRVNAAVQCVRCMHLLTRHLSAAGLGAASRVGVSSGFCISGSWGSGQRSDYTVIGTPVNLASRLQAEAGMHGGMLMDENTASLVRGFETLSPCVQLTLKGFGSRRAFALCAGAYSPVGRDAGLC